MIAQIIVLLVCFAALAWGVWAVVTQTPEERAKRRAKHQKKPPFATVTGSRPTAVRTALGFIFFGPIGALVGFAWRKKTRERIDIPGG